MPVAPRKFLEKHIAGAFRDLTRVLLFIRPQFCLTLFSFLNYAKQFHRRTNFPILKSFQNKIND